MAFETIDHAFENGHGKVVTASYPFIGWKDSVAAWNAKADFGGLAFGIAAELIFSMMYTYDALLPGSPVLGAVAGHVYRPVWEPGQSAPTYMPVEDAFVQVKQGNAPDILTIARTGSDGTFTLWDPQYTGGPIDVEAFSGDDYASGTAFEANVTNTRANNFANLYMTYGYAAEVNLTFPVSTPPPPSPDVEVNVMRLDQSNELLRTDINGIVSAETPLLIGFNFRNGVNAVIQNATVNGEEFPVRADDGGIGTGETMDFILSTLYTPRNAGTFEVKATALDPLGGAPTQVQHTFLVVAGAGSNNAGIPDVAPDWITRKLVPKPGSVGVAVDILPQVVFTEPVVNVVAGLQFTSDFGPVAFRLAASGVDAQGQPRTIPDLFLEPAGTKVTAITIIPIGGMYFNTNYTLRLTSVIEDTDVGPTGPEPRQFPDRELTFKTIDPEPLGDASEEFYAPAVAVVGDYAYVAKQTTGNGVMAVYDITDPEDLREMGRGALLGMPTHLSAEGESPMNDGYTLVAAGSGLKYAPPGPSNAYLFDVRNPEQPKRVGVVTLTESVEAGIVLRLALRKSFLYTITFPYGIQVIDVQRAIDIHRQAENDPAQRVRMGYDITVAGRGFGQAAVVNTVSVIDPDTGFKAHLMDLAAGEYFVGNSTRTLVMATGSTPFVVLDPTETSPRITQAPATTEGLLDFGRAITLTRSGNRDLALIVGTGQANNASGDLETGTALYIYDLVNPLVPNLIGSYIVDASASDVEVAGTTAVVATAAGALTFSIADPAHPVYLGYVPGVGYRIAIGQEGGYLVSTGTTSQSSAGLHVAAFKPVVIVKKADPVKIVINEPAGKVNTPQKVDAVEALKVTIKVLPVVSGLAGTVEVMNKHFAKSDGTDGGSTSFGPYPITWSSTPGEGTFTLPANVKYEDTDLVARATVASDNGTLQSAPRSIKLGWVRLELDSNNNTEIDALDREAARKGRPFGFWESEQYYEPKVVLLMENQGKKTESGGRDKGLADYFTVRITVNKLWSQATPGSHVRLWLGPMGADKPQWFVVPKRRAGKDYLRSKDYAAEQFQDILGPEPTLGAICVPSDDSIHKTAGECYPGTNGYVELPALKSGSYDLLVRCVNCLNRDTDGSLDTNLPKMWVDYVPGDSPTSGVHLDEAPVDIRPFRQWVTYVSARTEGDTREYKPLGKIDVGQRSIRYRDERESALIYEEQLLWANNLWTGSAVRVPGDARDVNVVVHGYAVPDGAMRSIFLPTVFKRLYWVGHPMHRLQGDWRRDSNTPGCVMNCAHTVGVSWPSNYKGVEPGERSTPFRNEKVSQASYPEDEYRAFATGPALAKYLYGIHDERPNRRIRVLAHSLGNLAVNAALTRPELDPHGGEKIIDTYVMNEAAFAAEAMSSSYPTDAMVLWGERHAEVYGYNNDLPWELDWLTMPFMQWPGTGTQLSVMWFNAMRRLEAQSGDISIDDKDFYTKRWRQAHPQNGLTDHQSGAVQPNRGPWRGIFANNTTRARIFNTWSNDDIVLKVIWRINQLEQKPTFRAARIGLERGLRLGWMIYTRRLPINIDLPPFRSADNMFFQRWGRTESTEPTWNSVFGDTPSQAWQIKRQWGELAFWFPATSRAAGQVSLDPYLNGSCNGTPCKTEMTEYSAYQGNWTDGESALGDLWKSRNDTDTHSYLAYGTFSKVFPAYDEIRKMFVLGN